MIKIASLLISAVLAASASDIAQTEAYSYTGIVSMEQGTAVFVDNLDLFDEIEEKNIFQNIAAAIIEKNISIGVVASDDISGEAAIKYYGQVSETEPDFALVMFNENEHSYYFYGSAAKEFSDDLETFWMTESYFEGDYYFAAAIQFPLDVQYHTASEEITEETAEAFPEDYFNEEVSDGIYTVGLENEHTALLHDLDDSLSSAQEAEILADITEAVQEKDFSIGIVITDDIGADKSDYGVMDFADVYYETYCGINTDGILLLINNDNKYDWISTSGGCIDMFYGRTDPIFDALYDYLVDGNYSFACQRFVQEVKYYSEQDYDYYSDYDYYFDGDEIEGIFSISVIIIFMAVISVCIFAGSLSSGYKMKQNVSAANYKLENSLIFSQNTDTFLRTYTTTRRVSSSSSGSRSGRSGGSRSHRSSGGGRHGGGGRRR